MNGLQQLLSEIHDFFYRSDQVSNNEGKPPFKRQRIGESAQKDSWEVVYNDLLKSTISLLAYETRDVVLDLSETVL
jgi:hypothetical protein